MGRKKSYEARRIFYVGGRKSQVGRRKSGYGQLSVVDVGEKSNSLTRARSRRELASGL